MPKIVMMCWDNYYGQDIRVRPLGGIATSVIMLAEAFARRGFEVQVCNGRDDTVEYEGVIYSPLSKARKIDADLVISNNSANHLWKVKRGVPVVWQHNRTSLSRAWKRKELLALYWFRPHLVALSDDAREKTPDWVPYRQIHVIPHGIEPMFLKPALDTLDSRPMRAFFASRATRNLKFAVEAWEQFVHPLLPEAEFVVCTPPSSSFPFDVAELEKHNILYKGSLQKNDLADLINTCRVLIYPGHVNETGCQVALQAIGLGLPIITCGHGSLKNLVQPKINGFVETEKSAYGQRIVECLTDQSLWLSLHQGALHHPWRKSYDERAADWEKAFLG